MVVESILDPAKAENKPLFMLILGFMLTMIATLIGYRFFPNQSSMIIVAFVALGATPLMYRLIKHEEQKDLLDLPEKILLGEHWRALKAFLYLFLGIVLATTLLFILLPSGKETQTFESQYMTFKDISGITGKATDSTEINELQKQTSNNMNRFSKIFFNNLTVLLIAIVFSFIYGAGAIFILTWNATVIGVAIGYHIRSGLTALVEYTGLEKIIGFLEITLVGLTQYLIHGFFEILGFFVGALAGGIISVAIIRHDLKSAKFEHIMLDAADLLLIAIGLIFFAAILEVWITPIFF